MRADRYSGRRRVAAGRGISPAWFRRQRDLGLIPLSDSGYLAPRNVLGLRSILRGTAREPQPAIAMLPIAARWFATHSVCDALAHEITKAGVPVALAIEHAGDPFAARYVLRGFLRLLSHVNVDVLNAFLERPEEMHAIAALLRSGAATGEFDELPDAGDAVIGDYGVREGRLLERRHLRREREPRLRKRKIETVLMNCGRLECEVCGFDFQRTYGARGAGYAECHHIIPLHASGDTVTRLEDLAVLCANCHRMIHRGPTWLTPAELRDIVLGTAAAVTVSR